MGKFIKGDIVVIPFPFSDLSGSKRRPALVVADLHGEDIILCQITSTVCNDPYSLPIVKEDFTEGTLPIKSFVRPGKIFTASHHLVLYRACRLQPDKMQQVTNTIVGLLEK